VLGEPSRNPFSPYRERIIMHTTLRKRLVVALGILAVPAATAAAQGTVAPAPRLSLSVGAAAMEPLHGDDYPEGPAFIGALGFAATPRVGLELELTRRSYTRETARNNVVLPYSGATGVPGRADRETTGRETSDWTAGVNLVGRTPPHLVTVYVGAGAGLHSKDQRNYRNVTNCTPPSGPAGPQGGPCTDRDVRSRTTNASGQVMAGADVTLARRWQLFAGARYELRQDLGMGSFGFGGGVRVGLR
jgi:outer membrane protein with beta-barrel domain